MEATTGEGSAAGEGRTPHLRRTLGLRDVVLLFITAGVNLQWVATAAAAGPSAITIWLLACASMAIPLGFSVVELSSRYPQQGGLYVWSKRAFGDFGGFISGWTYWMSNLPYLPGVLYFAAANALYILGDGARPLATSPVYFIAASLLGLGLATALNLVGLDVGKWLNNVGAVARWLATLALMGMGTLAFLRFGSATRIAPQTLVPGLQVKELIFWSTIAFALTGLESASFMGEEIRDARRTIPRAILISGPLIALMYILGTVSVLVALPAGEVSGLQGIMDAMTSAGHRLGLEGIAPIAAALITLSALGSVGLWLGAEARLPFVAGLDDFLPRGFARIHPRWGTPHVSLYTQSMIVALCIFLSQAGTTVRGAYDVLISMTVISYLIPFLFLFGALIRLQREPAGPEVLRVPGGRPVAVLLGAVGFTTTSVAIVLSFLPAPDEIHKGRAFAKILGLTLLMIGSGVMAYALAARRRRLAARSAGADRDAPGEVSQEGR